MNKAFWNHFKHFGRLLGKIYLLFTPSKTDGRIPSRQGAPTTRNLTCWEVSQQTYVQTLLASLGVRCSHSAKFSPSVGVGGGGCVAILHTKSQKTIWIIYFPATLSFQGYINFSKSPSQQKISWSTDILRNRSIGCPCHWLVVQKKSYETDGIYQYQYSTEHRIQEHYVHEFSRLA